MSGVRWAWWLVVLACAGCSVTVFRDIRYDAGQEVGSLRRVELSADADKAEVLAELGPPGEILPQEAGDIFVYRLRNIDVRVVQVNTGLVAPVGMPLYLRSEGLRTDDVLFVFFDPQGRVRDVSANWSRGGAR